MQKVVAVSGGFDPIHPGHIRLFRKAKEIAGRRGRVLVILNNDYWLTKKKGYSFMSQDERREILLNLWMVDDVVFTLHNKFDHDMSVVPELEMYRPDVFLNGGDRTEENTPERAYCEANGIEMIFNATELAPYEGHSSALVNKAVSSSMFTSRPWGSFKVHAAGKDWTLKTLTFKPNEETSVQSHKKRDEFWFLVEGSADFIAGEGQHTMQKFMSYVIVNRTAVHQIKAGREGAVIVEVMRGEYDEEDIIRYADKYGRD